MLSDKKKKKAIKAVSPVAMLADVLDEDKKNQTTGPILMLGKKINNSHKQQDNKS